MWVKKVLTFLHLFWIVWIDILGSDYGTSMIHIHLSRSDLESNLGSEFEVFSLTTNDYLEWHSSVLFQGILWNSHHFPIYFFIFPLLLFVCSLEWFSWGCASFLCPFFYVFGIPLPKFYYDAFTNKKSHLFPCLMFSRSWEHIDKWLPMKICLEKPFLFGCTYVDPDNILYPDVTQSLWCPSWCTR
jgi:hypothetical protein